MEYSFTLPAVLVEAPAAVTEGTNLHLARGMYAIIVMATINTNGSTEHHLTLVSKDSKRGENYNLVRLQEII